MPEALKGRRKTWKRAMKGSQSAELVVGGALESQRRTKRGHDPLDRGRATGGRIGIGLTGRGAFKVRRLGEGRNLKGTVQETRCLRSGWTRAT
jgi:hypothetical protein